MPLTITHRTVRRDGKSERWWTATDDAGDVVARVPEALFLHIHKRRLKRVSEAETAILEAILKFHASTPPEAFR